MELEDLDIDKLARSTALEAHTLLLTSNIKIALAESCTGGLVSKLLTDNPGSSKYLLGSVVAYHNSAKTNILSVSASTLTNYGAVSKETALEMANGAKKLFQSDLAISTTGIAGPEGGSPEKPVGLFYLGLSYKENQTTLKEVYSGTREQIRLYVSYLAFKMLIENTNLSVS